MLGHAYPLWLALNHSYAQLAKKTEDAASLAGARSVVIAGDDHDFAMRQRALQALELHERGENRRIGRPHCVKNVAGHQHQLRAQLDYSIDDRAK